MKIIIYIFSVIFKENLYWKIKMMKMIKMKMEYSVVFMMMCVKENYMKKIMKVNWLHLIIALIINPFPVMICFFND